MAVGEIIAGISGLKTVMDTLKGFKDIGDANTRNAVAVELQEKILSAYQAQMALTEQVGNLEKEVAQFKNWDAEKERYVLTDYGSGTFAYALKPDKANGEPLHRICPNCYEDGKRGLLQYKGRSYFSQDHYVCTRCKVEYFFGAAITPELPPTRSEYF